MIFSRTANTRFDTWHHPSPLSYKHSSHPCNVRDIGLRMNIDPFAQANTLPIAEASVVISSRSIIPTMLEMIANFIVSLTSVAASIVSFVLRLSVRFQDVGETLLTAFLILSVLQAAVALYQYRYDVRGQLIFPDGPTIGVEDYFKDSDNSESSCNSLKSNKSNDSEEKEADKLKILEYEIEPEDIYGMPYFLQKLNKSLLLLLPWITSNIHNLLTKNSHLFHIGFIITLVRFLEDTMLGSDDGDIKQEGEAQLTKESVRTGAKGGATAPPSLLEKLSNPQQKKDPIRALVIGDSLAVGTGCLEVFDPLKDNSTPMIFVENTTPPEQHKVSKLQPPVFPQILARTLSYCFRQPVHWRSGGVDRGDVNDIRKFCMDIIKQECAAASVVAPRKLGTTYISGAPDIVVVLFGMNDLKNLVSLNLIQVFRRGEDEDGGGIARHFRRGMEMLIDDIRTYAPNAYIVFPQLPIQTFHKNSIVNILPLGMFVDFMMGFWEGQKRRVMEGRKRTKGTISKRNTMYIDLDAKEIADWYDSNKDSNDQQSNEPDISGSESYDDIKDDILISADGVHPNKVLYARWSESTGKKFYQRIKPQLELMERKQQLAAKVRVDQRLRQLNKKAAL